MIKLSNLQKVQNQKTVLEIDDLEVPAGEIAALVGGVDSGIKNAFELLTGQTQPTMGRVSLGGINPHSDREQFSRDIGVIFAEDNLYSRRSALSNLKFYCRLHRLPMSRAVEVLTQVGLADQADTLVEKLSSSLKRRLTFGRALLHNPSMLLMEEPFNKCDEVSVTLLSSLIQECTGADATALIFNSSEDYMEGLCDTIYRLENGKIITKYHPKEEQRPELPFMIPARLEGKVALVDPVDILFVFSQDDRVYLQTEKERLPVQFTLTELEQRLTRSGFFRAHRSFLVNLQHVKEVIPYTRDSYTLRLKDTAGTEIPLSRLAARELRDLLGY